MYYSAGRHDRYLMVLLLAAYVIRVGAPEAATGETTPSADAENATAENTPPKTTPPATDSPTKADGDKEPPEIVDGVSSFSDVVHDVSETLSECKNLLMMEGSEIISAAEDAVLAGSRAMMATYGAAVNVYNGVANTASGVIKTTAHGYHWANEYIKPLALIGMITTGVDYALTEIADTFHDNTKNNVARRNLMVDEMHTKLDNARMEYAAVTVQSKTGKTAGTIPPAPGKPAAPGTHTTPETPATPGTSTASAKPTTPAKPIAPETLAPPIGEPV
ncbi:Hypothetical protein CINCED_3A011992 [Cinara cedri]|uniref:Uncharacterized protein n=1 Tax=Cinara cedri TaxID=506608 RepID=A0A5E4NLI9_9HEMI|nr:Hypothetical protein CINCED_3A011992 [Cinara cedri]